MKRPLRLCHVFPGFGPGGSQVRAARLMGATADTCEHTVVALNGDLRCADVAAPAHTGKAGPLRTVAVPDLGRLAAVGLKSLLQRCRPDLLLTYNWGAVDAVIAARMGRWPVIHHEDGFNPDEMDAQKRRRVFARRLLLRTVETVIVPSLTLADVARGDWRVPECRLAHVPNGVDLQRFCPGDAPGVRESLGASPTDIVVGSIGHLNPGKNMSMLLRALASLPEPRARLMIIGEGPEQSALRVLARRLGVDDRVHLLGHVSDPADHFRAMDVFALTSRTEQMPVSVLEAMASGLPVVATDVGDIRHMLPAADSTVVTPRDDLGPFSDALRRVAADRHLRQRLGNANRARCEADFGEPEMIARHTALWLRAAGGAVPELARLTG